MICLTSDPENTDSDSISLSSYVSLDAIQNQPAIISQNIRSYQRNFCQLKDILTRNPGIQIVALQELWGTDNIMPMPGFQTLIAKTRSKENGGGVGYLIKSGLSYRLNDSLYRRHI
jgi:hypothetical protein